jgi:class 3 adenylate cyclase
MEDPALHDIPVIMISGVDELNSVVKCIEMGAEDYLHKPINPILLKARINASLEKKRLRDRQRELIQKFATEEVAEELLTTGFMLGGKSVEATVMFSDIRSFTTIVESQPPAETIELLNDYYALMMDAIGSEGGVVNQMVGDGLMAIFGAPLPRADHCLRAARAALQMIELVQQYNLERTALGRMPIRIGIGIASGQVIAGFTGTQRRATYTCVGDTVNLAARLESQTKVVGKPILLDECARAGIGNRVPVEDEGTFEIKGKSVPVQIYSVKTEFSWS